MPAYKAALTLERVYADIPRDLVDEVIVVDNKGPDEAAAVALRPGAEVAKCAQTYTGKYLKKVL